MYKKMYKLGSVNLSSADSNEQRSLRIKNSIEIPPSDKGYMLYMKRHLVKEEAYKPILDTASEIEESHRDLCKKIQDVMVSAEPVSPSFQGIVTGKIRSVCPSLQRSKDVNLTMNNIYIDFFIFKVVFEKVSRKDSAITLSVKNSGRSNWVLMYQELFALGQGEESDMNILKKVIEELILDNDIKSRVEKYTEFHRQLSDYRRSDELKNRIEFVYDYIYGGQVLGGIGACDLCYPPNISP